MREAEKPARAYWQRPAILYGLYTAALFLFFLWATLPADVLLRRMAADLEASSGFHLEFGETSFGWHGHAVHGLRLFGPDRGDAALVEASWVAARPSVIGLLIGGEPFRVLAALYGGRCSGWVAWAGRRLEVACRDLDSSRYSRDGWSGHVSGELQLERGPGSDWLRAQGQVRLEARELRLGKIESPALALPELQNAQAFLAGQSIQNVQVAARLERGTLRVEEGTARTPDVEARLRGSILLRQPLAVSLPNLTLEVRAVSPAADALLAMLPGRQRSAAGGWHRFRLGGTLARPRLVPQAPAR